MAASRLACCLALLVCCFCSHSRLPTHRSPSASCLNAERGWCERLIDVASADSPLHLRMVLSPGATPAARVLLPRRLRQLSPAEQQRLQALEVCPQVRPLIAWSTKCGHAALVECTCRSHHCPNNGDLACVHPLCFRAWRWLRAWPSGWSSTAARRSSLTMGRWAAARCPFVRIQCTLCWL